MFTDGPATPVRLEVLLDTLKKYQSGLKRKVLQELLQPETLSGGGHPAAEATLGAALQLGLVEDVQSTIKYTKDFSKQRSTKDNILQAIDKYVLSDLKIEFNLALFYSYYLGLNEQVYNRLEDNREEWANRFNKDVFDNEPQKNPFNSTKYTGLDRWFCYIGLGWYDAGGYFMANPYERLLRVLPDIFDKKSKLQCDEFMQRLSNSCPELDGGDIFIKANKYRGYSMDAKQCTLGLSHALVDLHEDGIIQLDCPVDSRGWNIGSSQPPRDDTIKSDRITVINYLRK